MFSQREYQLPIKIDNLISYQKANLRHEPKLQATYKETPPMKTRDQRIIMIPCLGKCKYQKISTSGLPAYLVA
jgi:hypothetical protein